MFCRTWAARWTIPRTGESRRRRASRKPRKEARRPALQVPLQHRRARLRPARAHRRRRQDPARPVQDRRDRQVRQVLRRTRPLKASPPADRLTITPKRHQAPRIRAPIRRTGRTRRNLRRNPTRGRAPIRRLQPRLSPCSFRSPSPLRQHRPTPHQPVQIPPAPRRSGRTDRPQQPPRP